MEKATIASRFGIVVKQSRKKLRLSQVELAERAGLHRSYLSDIERGLRNVSLRNIEKLGEALEVPVEQLFSQMPRSNPEPTSESVPRPAAPLLLVKPETPASQARSRA